VVDCVQRLAAACLASHPDFPLRAFVRCESCGRGLTGTWSKGRRALRFEVPLREGTAGAGLQVALEAEGRGFIGELNGRDHFPGPVTCRVRATACVVRGEARREVVCQTDVRSRRLRHTPKNVDDEFGWHSALWCKRAAGGRSRRSARETIHDGPAGLQRLHAAPVIRSVGFCDFRMGAVDRTKVGLPTVALGDDRRPAFAPSALWRATSALTGERRLVDQIFPRWNPLTSWMRQTEDFQRAA
jgi:hypothetical protein